MRKVLLIEPNYKNKYPPIGLMKLSTYHKQIGDKVQFYKGELNNLIFDTLISQIIEKFTFLDSNVLWLNYKTRIAKYIKYRHSCDLEFIFEIENLNHPKVYIEWMKYYSHLYLNKKYEDIVKWDRICVSTLFTFYWDITIQTIEFSKKIVKTPNEIWVGGVMATLLKDEIKKETNIEPYSGLLDKPGIMDSNNIVIDNLPLDYSLLFENEYQYPMSNAYYGYMTRGCIRQCKYCAVPEIEKTFKPKVSIIPQIEYTKKTFGEQQNLLLLDNNVLASDCFSEIIEEIRDVGFYSGAVYIEPNQLDISMKNLVSGINDIAYIRKLHIILNNFLDKRVKGKVAQEFYNLLEKYKIINYETTTKDNLISLYPIIKDIFEKYRFKQKKQRYVDFNQGIDARFIDDNNMKLLSSIAIKPMRIAFDNIKFKEQYIKSIRLAAQYGIKDLSNYLLYNYDDKPEDLYERIEINVKLCEELNLNIYSFPMKYHPVGELKGIKWYKNRDYTGRHWNKKYIRAIQAILNSTKGKIGRGLSFFYKAFGSDLDEFRELLLLPETYIIYRLYYENNNKKNEWRKDFRALSESERTEAINIIISNNYSNLKDIQNKKIIKLLTHYLVKREDAEKLLFKSNNK